MTKMDLYNGISDVRAEFLDEADNYKKTKKVPWRRGIAVAACFCLLAVLFIPGLVDNKGESSPFVITVYAAGTSNDFNLENMGGKLTVPVSLFKTESGIMGFVFSYGNKEKGEPSTFSVYNNDDSLVVEPKLNEIKNLTIDDGKHYIFYIPGQNEEAPYQITLRFMNQGTECVVDICVEDTTNGYEASLERLTSYPVLDSSIEVNENGQTYGKDSHANISGEEPDLIYAEALDGTRGYVYASDLNADRANTPDELLVLNAKYQEIWNNAPAGEVVIARFIPLYESDGITIIGEFPITIGFKKTEDSIYPGLR